MAGCLRTHRFLSLFLVFGARRITPRRAGACNTLKEPAGGLWGILNKLVADLESNGFMLNPYDWCVANKVVNGKQMTVCWHVNDLKVSHCDPAQVTFFGEWLSRKYGVAVATHW